MDFLLDILEQRLSKENNNRVLLTLRTVSRRYENLASRLKIIPEYDEKRMYFFAKVHTLDLFGTKITDVSMLGGVHICG